MLHFRKKKTGNKEKSKEWVPRVTYMPVAAESTRYLADCSVYMYGTLVGGSNGGLVHIGAQLMVSPYMQSTRHRRKTPLADPRRQLASLQVVVGLRGG